SARRFGEEALERHRVRCGRRVALCNAGEWRWLCEPLFLRRQAPRRHQASIRRIPADPRDLDVHRLIVRVERLDPMAVGIAEIHVHGMAGAMPAGPTLDTAAKPERAGDIAGVEDVVAFGARECSVMQARTRLLEEHDVVRIALALQEDAGE